METYFISDLADNVIHFFPRCEIFQYHINISDTIQRKLLKYGYFLSFTVEFITGESHY